MDEKNTQQKQIPTVELGGRVWDLRFGHKAMKRYCSMTRCNMETFDRTLIFYENQIKLLWCMISAQDPTVTEDQLDDWLDEVYVEDILGLIDDAVAAGMPKSTAMMAAQQKADAAAEGAEENPTGTTTSTSA